ncbi:MAG: PD-(D/E)XK nuclease family protein [Planctomycetes bacterium]|nr:PD-(D/E)XK nuclease family protein [Planctomycetota bacterium]
MRTIIPSTRLMIINVSKLKDYASCPRKYYWRYIKNLESIYLNMAFWYGSRSGAGAEALLQGKSWKQAQKMMKAEDRRYFDRYKINEINKEALEINHRLIDIILKAFRRHDDFNKMKIISNQNKFAVRLKDSGILFTGTEDGQGTYNKMRVLFEIKNLKQVSKNTLKDLIADKQINGYSYARSLLGEAKVTNCIYLIFRKSSKWIKEKQSVDDFVAEIEQDVIDRRDFYFTFKKIRLGTLQVEEVAADIECWTNDLKCKYRRLDTDEAILDPHNWPRSSACSNFAGCVYRKPCFEPKRRAVWMNDFQARELRYEGEQQELQTVHK